MSKDHGNEQVRIYYFSGTGNTKAVSGMLSESLEINHCCLVDMQSIESSTIDESLDRITPDDLIGIAYPIYGFGCPSNMIAFVRKLATRLQSGQRVFILQTAADFIRVNQWAGAEISDILIKSGIHIQYERIIVMPSNFFTRYSDHLNRQLYESAKRKACHMAEELVSAIERRPAKGQLGKWLTSLVHYGEERCGAAIFSKSLKAGDSCDRCGVCVKSCPTGNPHMTADGVRFGGSCIMCMRCVYKCHRHCITSSMMNWVILNDGYDLSKIAEPPAHENISTIDDLKMIDRHFYDYLNDNAR